MKAKYEVEGVWNGLSNSQYEAKLWSDWLQCKNEEHANNLIHHYMYIVQYHVERISSYIPASFDKADLKSLGLIGLYDALQKFEPKRNLKFDTYATIRVHGSIMDGLRKEDWLPRTLRDKAKQIDKASELLQQQLNRTPTAFDIAKALAIQPEEVEATIVDTMMANVQSLDAPYHTNEADEPLQIGAFVQDNQTTTPNEQLLTTELKEELVQSIKQLNENEQLVISLFYIEELTLTEIGKVLDLTTSRISQIHKRAIFKLRGILSQIPQD